MSPRAVDIPVQMLARGLGDLAAMARRVPDLPERLDRRASELQARLDGILALGRTLQQRAERVTTSIEMLDERAAAIIELAERIVVVGEEITRVAQLIVDTGAQIVTTGNEIVVRGDRIVDRGDAIVERGDRIVDRGDQIVAAGVRITAAVPAITRAVEIMEPLEGTVQRMGRIADRVPGGRRRARSTQRARDAETVDTDV